jgi:hypothetical protein
MEPGALIVAALAAGAAESAGAGSSAVTDAYGRLKALVSDRLDGMQDAGLVLAGYEESPGAWQERLVAALEQAGAHRDPGLVAAAASVLRLAGEARPRAAGYAVDAQEAHGVQVGSHNTQFNVHGNLTWIEGAGPGREASRREGKAAAWAAGATALVAALIGAYVVLAPHGSSTPARVYSDASYGFSSPNRIADDGMHVWVTNPPGNSVTELNASDGSLIRILAGAGYGLAGPVGIADDGAHVWVTSTSGNSVTELNASDGSLVRILGGAGYGFDAPVGVASDGTHVWVANTEANSVTELNASNGGWVTTLNGVGYGFSGPWGIAVSGTHVWVANSGGNSVTELTTG